MQERSETKIGHSLDENIGHRHCHCQGHCLEVSWSTRNGSLPPSGSQLTDFKLFTSVLFHFSFIMCFSLSVFALWFLSGICSVCSPHFPISNCWHLLCMILHLKWLPTWQMKCNKSLLFLSTGNLCRLCKRDSQRFHRVKEGFKNPGYGKCPVIFFR